MDAKALLSSLLLLPLTGCAISDRAETARSGDIDAQLHGAIVAELLGGTTCSHPTRSGEHAPGPSLIAGDMIALAWLTAHAELAEPDVVEKAESVIPTFDDTPVSPNLALWTPPAWDMLGY